MAQPMTGSRSSMNKMVGVIADDNNPKIYKKMGNGHNALFMWAETITVSGTEAVVASGIKYNGKEVATYGYITATPRSAVSTPYYVTRDTTNNIVKIESTATVTADFDVMVMIG